MKAYPPSPTSRRRAANEAKADVKMPTTSTRTGSVTIIREALARSLEEHSPAARPLTPTKKLHETRCGYCYYAKKSWQIRFKPYGLATESVGVLGGEPAAQNKTKWLGMLVQQEGAKEGDPPAALVISMLKRAELRNILQLARQAVAGTSKKNFLKLLVKLRDDSYVDLAPCVGEILGVKRLRKFRTLKVLDCAVALLKSTKIPGLITFDHWKITCNFQEIEEGEYENILDSTIDFVQDCLSDADISEHEEKADEYSALAAAPEMRLTPQHQQVAGAATGETSREASPPRGRFQVPVLPSSVTATVTHIDAEPIPVRRLSPPSMLMKNVPLSSSSAVINVEAKSSPQKRPNQSRMSAQKISVLPAAVVNVEAKSRTQRKFNPPRTPTPHTLPSMLETMGVTERQCTPSSILAPSENVETPNITLFQDEDDAVAMDIESDEETIDMKQPAKVIGAPDVQKLCEMEIEKKEQLDQLDVVKLAANISDDAVATPTDGPVVAKASPINHAGTENGALSIGVQGEMEAVVSDSARAIGKQSDESHQEIHLASHNEMQKVDVEHADISEFMQIDGTCIDDKQRRIEAKQSIPSNDKTPYIPGVTKLCEMETDEEEQPDQLDAVRLKSNLADDTVASPTDEPVTSKAGPINDAGTESGAFSIGIQGEKEGAVSDSEIAICKQPDEFHQEIEPAANTEVRTAANTEVRKFSTVSSEASEPARFDDSNTSGKQERVKAKQSFLSDGKIRCVPDATSFDVVGLSADVSYEVLECVTATEDPAISTISPLSKTDAENTALFHEVREKKQGSVADLRTVIAKQSYESRQDIELTTNDAVQKGSTANSETLESTQADGANPDGEEQRMEVQPFYKMESVTKDQSDRVDVVRRSVNVSDEVVECVAATEEPAVPNANPLNDVYTKDTTLLDEVKEKKQETERNIETAINKQSDESRQDIEPTPNERTQKTDSANSETSESMEMVGGNTDSEQEMDVQPSASPVNEALYEMESVAKESAQLDVVRRPANVSGDIIRRVTATDNSVLSTVSPSNDAATENKALLDELKEQKQGSVADLRTAIVKQSDEFCQEPPANDGMQKANADNLKTSKSTKVDGADTYGEPASVEKLQKYVVQSQAVTNQVNDTSMDMEISSDDDSTTSEEPVDKQIVVADSEVELKFVKAVEANIIMYSKIASAAPLTQLTKQTEIDFPKSAEVTGKLGNVDSTEADITNMETTTRHATLHPVGNNGVVHFEIPNVEQAAASDTETKGVTSEAQIHIRSLKSPVSKRSHETDTVINPMATEVSKPPNDEQFMVTDSDTPTKQSDVEIEVVANCTVRPGISKSDTNKFASTANDRGDKTLLISQKSDSSESETRDDEQFVTGEEKIRNGADEVSRPGISSQTNVETILDSAAGFSKAASISPLDPNISRVGEPYAEEHDTNDQPIEPASRTDITDFKASNENKFGLEQIDDMEDGEICESENPAERSYGVSVERQLTSVKAGANISVAAVKPRTADSKLSKLVADAARHNSVEAPRKRAGTANISGDEEQCALDEPDKEKKGGEEAEFKVPNAEHCHTIAIEKKTNSMETATKKIADTTEPTTSNARHVECVKDDAPNKAFEGDQSMHEEELTPPCEEQIVLARSEIKSRHVDESVESKPIHQDTVQMEAQSTEAKDSVVPVGAETANAFQVDDDEGKQKENMPVEVVCTESTVKSATLDTNKKYAEMELKSADALEGAPVESLGMQVYNEELKREVEVAITKTINADSKVINTDEAKVVDSTAFCQTDESRQKMTLLDSEAFGAEQQIAETVREKSGHAENSISTTACGTFSVLDDARIGAESNSISTSERVNFSGAEASLTKQQGLGERDIESKSQERPYSSVVIRSEELGIAERKQDKVPGFNQLMGNTEIEQPESSIEEMNAPLTQEFHVAESRDTPVPRSDILEDEKKLHEYDIDDDSHNDLKIDVTIDSSDAQVATPSDAAEVLALTAADSFDVHDLIKQVEPMQDILPMEDDVPLAARETNDRNGIIISIAAAAQAALQEATSRRGKAVTTQVTAAEATNNGVDIIGTTSLPDAHHGRNNDPVIVVSQTATAAQEREGEEDTTVTQSQTEPLAKPPIKPVAESGAKNQKVIAASTVVSAVEPEIMFHEMVTSVASTQKNNCKSATTGTPAAVLTVQIAVENGAAASLERSNHQAERKTPARTKRKRNHVVFKQQANDTPVPVNKRAGKIKTEQNLKHAIIKVEEEIVPIPKLTKRKRTPTKRYDAFEDHVEAVVSPIRRSQRQSKPSAKMKGKRRKLPLQNIEIVDDEVEDDVEVIIEVQPEPVIETQEDDQEIAIHWEKLDHKMIISDYVYSGNDSLAFGDTTVSALKAVDNELAKIDVIENSECREEEKMYKTSLTSRGRMTSGEKASRQKEKAQHNAVMRELKKKRPQKKTPEQAILDSFVNRKRGLIVYDDDSKGNADEAMGACPNPSCRLCIAPPDPDFATLANIPAPIFRPSTVTDSWREHSVDDEPEPTGKKGKSAPAANKRRSRRRSHRSSNKTGLMLLEMKHSLQFIDDFNRGYLP